MYNLSCFCFGVAYYVHILRNSILRVISLRWYKFILVLLVQFSCFYFTYIWNVLYDKVSKSGLMSQRKCSYSGVTKPFSLGFWGKKKNPTAKILGNSNWMCIATWKISTLRFSCFFFVSVASSSSPVYLNNCGAVCCITLLYVMWSTLFIEH